MESGEVLFGEGAVKLAGILSIPDQSRGLVIFAHGSGSGRFSPRNNQTATYLRSQGLGTFLFDLLTQEEAADRANIFDIPLLASRLALATRWAKCQESCARLPYGFFGASTGGGAALWAASELPDVAAVVSRGGRPDLAGSRLQNVRAPVLLLVGGVDTIVLALNRQAARAMPEAELMVVPGASHLFEEPGAMERVEQESARWFLTHFHGGEREVA